MQDVYSWLGTNIHLPMSEETANAYNRVADAFAEIPQDHDFKKPFELKVSREDMDIWNALADIINALIRLNGGSLDYTEEETPTNHFIKVV